MSRQDSRKIEDVKVLLVKGKDGSSIGTIEKTSTSGLVDTYTITLTDGSSATFEVTNGNGIVSIKKTSTSGLIDTYTITYDDDTTSTFTVTNSNVDAVVQMLAPMETTSTASQAYEVGEFLVFNSRLCKVTTAIAQDDTLEIGTNIEYDTVGNELEQINSGLADVTENVDEVVQMIAPMETTSTASQAYEVGEFLVFNSRLCKVTTAIAQDDTLEVGTNIEYDTVGNELEQINSGLADVTAEFDDFADIHGLKNKNILIIGDSISDETLYPNCWVKDFKAICANLGINVTNHSLQGRTIGRYSGATNYLMNVLSSIPSGTYDEIILFLGTNDWLNQVDLGYYGDSNTNSVINNIVQFYEWKRTNQPNANVTMVTPLKTKYANDIRHKLMQFYCTAIASTASFLGFGVIDAHSFAPLLTTKHIDDWTADGIHPIDAYAPYLARFIFNNLVGRTKSIGLNNIKTVLAIGDVGGNATHVYMRYSGDGECSYLVQNYNVSGTGNVKLADLPEECRTLGILYGTGLISVAGTIYNVTLLSTGSALYVYKPSSVPDGTLSGSTDKAFVPYVTYVSETY